MRYASLLRLRQETVRLKSCDSVSCLFAISLYSPAGSGNISIAK